MAFTDFDGDGRLDVVQAQGEVGDESNWLFYGEEIPTDVHPPQITALLPVWEGDTLQRIGVKVHDGLSGTRSMNQVQLTVQNEAGETIADIPVFWSGGYIYQMDVTNGESAPFSVCAADPSGNTTCSAIEEEELPIEEEPDTTDSDAVESDTVESESDGYGDESDGVNEGDGSLEEETEEPAEDDTSGSNSSDSTAETSSDSERSGEAAQDGGEKSEEDGENASVETGVDGSQEDGAEESPHSSKPAVGAQVAVRPPSRIQTASHGCCYFLLFATRSPEGSGLRRVAHEMRRATPFLPIPLFDGFAWRASRG